MIIRERSYETFKALSESEVEVVLLLKVLLNSDRCFLLDEVNRACNAEAINELALPSSAPSAVAQAPVPLLEASSFIKSIKGRPDSWKPRSDAVISKR